MCQNAMGKIEDALLDCIYKQQPGEIRETTFCGGEGYYTWL